MAGKTGAFGSLDPATLVAKPTAVQPVSFFNAPSIQGPSLVATYPVDLEKVARNGADFLLVTRPTGVYKMTVFPRMVIGISFTPAASSKEARSQAWSFRNTFTRTRLVGKPGQACAFNCFDTTTAKEIWDVVNLTKFNMALAQVASFIPSDVLPSMPELDSLLSAMKESMATIVAPPLLASLSDTALARDPQEAIDPDREAEVVDEVDTSPLFQDDFRSLPPLDQPPADPTVDDPSAAPEAADAADQAAEANPSNDPQRAGTSGGETSARR